MKKNFSDKPAVPVPRWGGGIFVLTGLIVLLISAAAGYVTAPDERNMPVLLANGEVITAPWYITVDGEKVALVESEEDAQAVIENVVSEYGDEAESVLSVNVEEETSAEKMDIKNGDKPPEILSVEEAEKHILNGNDGESYITVVTVEQQTDYESIEFEEEYKPAEELYIGQTEIEVEGREGCREITKEVIKENGESVKEEIIDEEIIRKPQEQIVLAGTKSILKTPVDEICISSDYGPRWGRMHNGTDFALSSGENIYAAESGTVCYAGYCGGYGNLVKIEHDNGMQTCYAHCSEIIVSDGQRVERGDVIALVGSTGNSTGPHLHFEVVSGGNYVDPVTVLNLE